jgi:hypothetical protein
VRKKLKTSDSGSSLNTLNTVNTAGTLSNAYSYKGMNVGNMMTLNLNVTNATENNYVR